MKTLQRETDAVKGLLAGLAEKLGQDSRIRETASALDGLLDEEGVVGFFRLVDVFASVEPSLALHFMQTGKKTLAALKDRRARHEALDALLSMGRSKWSVAERACAMLPRLSGADGATVSKWIRYGSGLAEIDQDVALQYFDGSIDVLESIGPERFDAWAALGHEMAKQSWKAAREYFRSSPEVLKKIDHCDLERWARIGLYLIEKSPRVKAGYDAHSLLAAGAAAGKSRKVELAVQYFKSAPQVLGRLTMNDLEEWVVKGLEVADATRDKGASYFSLQTGSSRDVVENLVKGLELRDIHAVLRSYAEALIGRKLQMRSSSLFFKNLPGLSRSFSVTDGTRIFLPSRIDIFDDEDLNFRTYKWMLTHELGHLMHGTFTIGVRELSGLAATPNPVFAFRVFEFLEDERVDHLLAGQYPGLERDRLQLMETYTGLGNRRPELYATDADPLMRDALARVTSAGCSVHDVYGLALEICSTIAEAAVCNGNGAAAEPERHFYRGMLDFELVENARTGMSRLVFDLVERFQEKKLEMSAETVEAALSRIEETLPVEAEELLWQVTDNERLGEIFEQVQGVIAEMETEKRCRRAVYYDEWDRRLDDYRKDWCRVREIDMPETNAHFYSETIAQHYGLVSLLRRHFGLLRPDRVKRFFREERGDDLDLDAAVESVVERHAGVTPSDRVYIRREKNLRDVSVAFLVDMSYSTGDELPSGRRIIDVEREGLVLMAEALESIGDQWAVYGFSSNYRDKVDFFVVRDFGENFSRTVKMRFENIRPIAQTRLGAAIRHANSLLARQPSRIRLLILLSDGRPYDIDYGDADYAVEDTRRALWEGRRKGVSSFCITVDKKSRDYLPYMYGEANYTLIDNIESMPARLPLIYKRLTT